MNKFKEELKKTGEIGYVTQVIDTLVYANGIPGAKPDEVVVFETGEMGQVLSLLRNEVEILTFSKNPIKVGTSLTRTGKALEVPAGEELLGNVIDPFGKSLEEVKSFKKPKEHIAVNTDPEGIVERKTIKNYLETGTSVVDLMIPLGKGQRELVIGDRKTGKTNFLLHTIYTQAKMGTICIYACIGKKKMDIKKAQEFFVQNKIMDKVVIIASTSTDPAGEIFITPYSALAVAEHFRNIGKDALLVLDDMSTHAKFYREISLLGKRFPGRNSYPGDIFYVHARLIERAGNFVVGKGESSITCLPVVETNQGDLSGYIQTNLMSMTDGHLFFDSNLFYQGRRPAINPFLSVTRVGRQTQSEIKRSINRELTTFLTLYERVQNFVHFGSELNDTAKVTLDLGNKILRLFDQPSGKLIPSNVQIIVFTILWGSLIPTEGMDKLIERRENITEKYNSDPKFRKTLDDFVDSSQTLNDLMGKIKKDGDLVNRIISL